uniref:DNA-directed RNA polymerase subunit n=1 Tax=Pterocladiophila hemisphaerica TaxID=2712948 RepID=A0A6M3WWA8_9FLOR|nr:RNA polymerase beta' subunit [Pterocladiophila hemisphaerica]
MSSDQKFDYLKINLASPLTILKWGQRYLPNGESVGEVKKSETINYRTLKPEVHGLFCERIFGPIKNKECACSKYKKSQFQNFFCEKCGVEFTNAAARRYRMGYIKLVTSVSHVWYFKGTTNYISLALDFNVKDLEKVLYFHSYIVLKTDDSNLFKYKELIENSEWKRIEQNLSKTKKATIEVGIGAEAILILLNDLNLVEISSVLREESLSNIGVKNGLFSQFNKKMKRLRLLENFIATGAKLSWMILSIIPVMPPAIRPIVRLAGGRFATSDLNEFYRRIINRNNRLIKLNAIVAPAIIIRNEKRMLQESVDGLIDNGRHGKVITTSNNRPLKSLSDIIEGKQGRFRQNLLGKRVDYSGRSVIVVAPNLKLHQCGLPKEMALELFQPFIIHQLIKQKLVNNIKVAKTYIDNKKHIIWSILTKIVKVQPILLNRAPTLHKLGIQSFEAILVPGRAIQLHPLVCTAFNADFDGDQMAVHVPLSEEAQEEARLLMFASQNFLSPGTGKPIVLPTQEMVLGCYYLTVNNPSCLNNQINFFSNINDVIQAYSTNQLQLHDVIWVRSGHKKKSHTFLMKTNYIRTTVGRIIFNYQFFKN